MFSIVLLAALLLLCGVHFRLSRRHRAVAHELALRRDEVTSCQRVLQQLRSSEKRKDEFIAEVSHELRTPLTSLRGALGLLSSGMLGTVEERAAHLLRIASSNTDRLVRLVNDILDLERMESEVASLPMRSCPVRELIDQAVETMSPMADATGVQLLIDPHPATGQLTIRGNPDRMLQVLCNLLSNAIKFSPDYAPVYLQTAVEADVLVIRVEDRGRGVPADKLEAIFERFGQVDPSDSRQKGGTGLGLAICRSIIAQHAGTIHAERNDSLAPGRPGATLVIRLPLPVENSVVPVGLHHLLA